MVVTAQLLLLHQKRKYVAPALKPRDPGMNVLELMGLTIQSAWL